MSEMDVDQLIEEVRKRPHLWDRCNSYHSNRRASDKSWSEIAELMQEDESKLRKKWRYLRDQFSVEYGKIPPASEDEVNSYEPKWRFYKQLQFLEEVVTPRLISKQLKRDDESSEQSNSAPASPDSEVVYKKRRRASEVPAEKQSRKHRDAKEREKKKARTRERERASEDGEEHMYFFRSLLPHVRCIPAQLQLPFRSKVQRLVEQFAYGESAAEIDQRTSPISTQTTGFEEVKRW